MKILVAPDKYRGTLTAEEAARGIARGISHSPLRDAEVVCTTLADGGEGSAECISRYSAEHVVEAATLIGHESPEAKKSAMQRSSWSLGVSIAEAAGTNDDRITVCLGGTSTVDCGVGMLQALGAVFCDKSGRPVSVPACANQLAEIASADFSAIPRLNLRILCDVRVPLAGALDFAVQKGVALSEFEHLGALHRHFADMLGVSDTPHGGCAGGIGYAFEALKALAPQCDIVIEDGAEYLIRLAGLTDMKPDIIITGEGRFDRTSMMGKVTGTLMRWCAQTGTTCIIVPGAMSKGLSIPSEDRIVVQPCSDFYPTLSPAAALEAATAKAISQIID